MAFELAFFGLKMLHVTAELEDMVWQRLDDGDYANDEQWPASALGVLWGWS